MFARSTRMLLWICSIAAIVAFFSLSFYRIAIQVPAEPAEHVLLAHAERLASGQPLYRAPESRLAIPLMPGMPWMMSLLVWMFGPALWEARVLTLLGSLAVAALTWLIVRAETRSGLMGAVSAGLMLAGLGAFELRHGSATPEPIALALGFGALCLLRFTSGIWGPIGAALLTAASFFVHPLGAGMFVASLAYLVLHHPRHGLIFATVAAIVWGGGYVALSEWLGAWFNFNAWDAPIALLRFQPLRLLHALGDELLGRLGVLTFSAVLAFALPVKPWRGPTGLWMWGAIAAVGFSLLATQNLRVTSRDLLPALAALAIVGPISAQRVTQHLGTWPGSSRIGGQTVVMAALVLQFVMLLAGATAVVWPPVA